MNVIRRRLVALEESRHGTCPECYQKPKTTLAYYPGHGESAPAAKLPTCPECGRPLAHVLRVVCEGDESEAKGEGVLLG